MKLILAQIFSILGCVAMIISNNQKSRKKILFFLFFDNLFYFLQYIMLDAYTGAFSNLISLFRTVLFNKKSDTKFYKKNYALYLVLLLHLLIGIITFDGIKSLFPMVASISYAIVLYQDNTKKIRLGTSLMLLMWVIYNIFVQAYVGVLTESILLLASIIAIIRFDIKKGDKNNGYENI